MAEDELGRSSSTTAVFPSGIAERAKAAERARERELSLKAEAIRRHRLREAEADAEKGEHRGGSGKRDSYTAKEKLEQVDVIDRI